MSEEQFRTTTAAALDDGTTGVQGSEAVRRYIEMRVRKPLIGLGESIHRIHTTTEYEAEVTISDLCALLAERDALKKASEWQPIETAPKDRVGPGSWENCGPRLQVYDGSYVRIAKWEWHKNGKTGNWKTDDGRVTYKVPTHWKHLPALPQVHP